MISVLTQQQLVLLGVAAHKLYSQPIALAAYSVLLERAAEAGGEAIPVTASGLGGAINVGGKTATQALCYLEEKGFITIGQKRTKSKRIIYISIVSLNCESILEKDVVTNGVTNEVTNGVTNGVTKKKEKETKEESFPRTSFREERKDKKKERLGKEEKKKNAYASLKERREQFWNSLLPFGDRYGSETLQSFYAHWIKRDRATGIMDFESDPKFELEVALHEWYLNRQLFKQGRGRRGSVAAEVTAEQERQQKRICEQEASLKVVRERDRLLKEMKAVPPMFYQLMKDEGKNFAEVTADEIFTLLCLRRDSRTLTSEQTQAFNDWEIRRNRTAEALRRMESG